MQTASYKILTQITESIYYVSNHYTTNTSIIQFYLLYVVSQNHYAKIIFF